MDEKFKTEIQKLMNYQKADIELRKLTAVIERDDALVSMNKQKKLFNDAKQIIADCEDQAAALISQYEELQRYVDNNTAALDELENSQAETEAELSELVRKLESIRSKIQSADKKIRDIDDRSKNICHARVDAIKSGKAAQAKFNEAREKHSGLIDSKSDQIKKLRSDLEGLRAGLDEKLFGEYKKLVEDNKFPPVVPASGDDKKGLFNCGGCGLSLPQQGNAFLKDRGWCYCDNCHRIIVHLK